jgi:hypothetical protein
MSDGKYQSIVDRVHERIDRARDEGDHETLADAFEYAWVKIDNVRLEQEKDIADLLAACKRFRNKVEQFCDDETVAEIDAAIARAEPPTPANEEK